MSYVMLKQGLGAEIVMVLIPSRHTSAIMCLRILMCFNDFFTAICKTIECILLNEKLLDRTRKLPRIFRKRFEFLLTILIIRTPNQDL